MARVTVEASDPTQTPKGIDLSLVESKPVAIFGAAIVAGTINSGGEMKASLIVPFAQIPNLMPVFQYVGGVMFKVTVERVSVDDMPEGGWDG